MTTEEYFAWLHDECGYSDPRVIPNDRCAYIIPKMYTHAIGTSRIGDKASIGDCWCYPNYAAARNALDAWDGHGEPDGWIRHPDSGRRLATTAGERDQNNELVPVGQRYVRR